MAAAMGKTAAWCFILNLGVHLLNGNVLTWLIWQLVGEHLVAYKLVAAIMQEDGKVKQDHTHYHGLSLLHNHYIITTLVLNRGMYSRENTVSDSITQLVLLLQCRWEDRPK